MFWNYHSADNSSDYDYGFNGNVTHFLALAREHDLFVLWRFGPYVCAEWPAGGVPAWVRAPADAGRRRRRTPSGMTLRPRFFSLSQVSDIDGMQTRCNNSAWLAETQRWMEAHFAEIEPFLPRHGGNVLASQIENEYSGSDADPAAVACVRPRARARARARREAARLGEEA